MFAPPPNPDDVHAPVSTDSEVDETSHRLSIAPPFSIRLAQYSVLILIVTTALVAFFNAFVRPHFDALTPTDFANVTAPFFIALVAKVFVGWLAYLLGQQEQWAWITLLVLVAVAFLLMTPILVIFAMPPMYYVSMLGFFYVTILATVIGSLCTPSSLRWMRFTRSNHR